MDNRNTVIALVLMFLVWAGFTLFFPQSPPRSVQPAQPAPVTSAPVSSEIPSVAPVVVAQHAPVDVAPATSVREIVVDTDMYRAVFSTAGARLVSLSLKQFHIANASESPLVKVVDVAAPQSGTLRLSGVDGFSVGSEDIYSVEGDRTSLQLTGTAQGDLIFRTTSRSGLLVEKRFRFSADKYAIDIENRLINRSAATLQGHLQLALVQPWDENMSGNMNEFVGPMTLVNGELETDAVDKLAKEPRNYTDNLVWSGFTLKYFLSSLVPLDTPGSKVTIRKSHNLVENVFETPAASLQPGQSLQYRYLAFFGPLQMDVLQATGHQLERSIDFGFFSILAEPLFHVLVFFYSYIGNYGWAIILLTIIIKLLFWPLTQKSYSSMKAMQKLQPEMQKLREKFKNDRDRMNREIMDLYKNHRVNPVGGCLPMLVQIPVFFALYKVLMISIELRHAPFLFWITDLSAKDPYYITPLIMGVTMFIQQKMTPMTSVDPIQAKIFLFMPVVFTFLFLNFPSGLVIYWMVNNLLTILQQYFINRAPN